MKTDFMVVAVITALCIMSSGCATTPASQRPPRYRAGVTSRTEGARVRGQFKGFLPGHVYILTLDKVDGKVVIPRGMITPVLLDPGERNLTVQCVGNGWVNVWGRAELKATLLAGQDYQLRSDCKKDLVTFWVEDRKTKLLAGERVEYNATAFFQPVKDNRSDGAKMIDGVFQVLDFLGHGSMK